MNRKSLKDYNTFGIDCAADTLIEVYSVEDIPFTYQSPEMAATPFLILGSGSNVLFTGDFYGLVLVNRLRGITVAADDDETITLEVASGEVWDAFVEYAVANRYWGIENLSFIPGTVGAAPVQNIGAYGQEVKDVIVSVTYKDLITGEKIKLQNDACAFSYRDSVFKQRLLHKCFITSVTFRLHKTGVPNLQYQVLQSYLLARGNRIDIADIRQAVIAIRQEKLPDVKTFGNAGSFFKNPEVSQQKYQQLLAHYPDLPGFTVGNGNIRIPAGWLIEKCGFKGKRAGDVGTYEKQALVVINYGGATGQEVLNFAENIISGVHQRFQITLIPEVNIIL